MKAKSAIISALPPAQLLLTRCNAGHSTLRSFAQTRKCYTDLLPSATQRREMVRYRGFEPLTPYVFQIAYAPIASRRRTGYARADVGKDGI